MVRPLGSGLLSFYSKANMAFSSFFDTYSTKNSFSSLLQNLEGRMFFTISIIFTLSSSLYNPLKLETSVSVISLNVLTILPSPFWISQIVLIFFLWLVKLWKYLVFLSPLANHRTLFFNLHCASFSSKSLLLYCSNSLRLFSNDSSNVPSLSWAYDL